jgi:hypothetical protein
MQLKLTMRLLGTPLLRFYGQGCQLPCCGRCRCVLHVQVTADPLVCMQQGMAAGCCHRQHLGSCRTLPQLQLLLLLPLVLLR